VGTTIFVGTELTGVAVSVKDPVRSFPVKLYIAPSITTITNPKSAKVVWVLFFFLPAINYSPYFDFRSFESSLRLIDAVNLSCRPLDSKDHPSLQGSEVGHFRPEWF
jgi:hypothetical protein